MNKELSELVRGREISLQELLDAREKRQKVQKMLLARYHLPVVSFTLNIPGKIKVFPLAVKAFQEGIRLIELQLRAFHIPALCEHTVKRDTGYEAYWAVDGEENLIKEILCFLEETITLGRVFDIDVIGREGKKVSREELGFSARRCLLCDQEAFVCGRARSHSVEELLKRECHMITAYFDGQYARKLASLSMEALLYEVSVTPKPGLVDRNNQGAHQDMDIFLFEASAVSLSEYFEKCVLCGMEQEEDFSRIFARLRFLGIQAEDIMYKTTKNVNTHKGVIFSLGILNCALGYLRARGIPYSPEKLMDISRRLAAVTEEDFKKLTADNAKTDGERLYVLYGMKGARGEAMSGYPTVFHLALPVLKDCIGKGYSINDAGALTLLYILAYSEDTNIASRSSYEKMKEIQKTLRRRLEAPADIIACSMNAYKGCLEYLKELDEDFIRRNISPGGSADLLALTYFVLLHEKSGKDAEKSSVLERAT